MAKSEIGKAIGEVVKSLSPQLEDIKNTTTMSSLILSVCLIDTLAGFYCGFEGEGTKHKSRFNKFTEKYLPKYSSFLYDLRNGLVHSFSNQSNFMFTESNEFSNAFPNLRKILDKEIFDVNEFKKSIKDAFEEYIHDISDLDNNNLRANFMKRFKKLGIIKEGGIPVLRNSKGEIVSHINDADKLPGTDIPFGIADRVKTKN
jgi:hypothetical protein